MNYLITGIAGSGKSTVAEILRSHGRESLDADNADYSRWVERSTGKSLPSRPSTEDWVNRFDWNWKEDEMRGLLSEDRSKNLFVCGISNNQSAFYPLFHKIFLLSVGPDTIGHRLLTRTNNPFGKRPGDLEQTLSWQKEFEEQMKMVGAIVIDGTKPKDEVAQDIVSYVSNEY
ncbi:hypothetical protein A3D14_02540 [Candidatus Saccharibacteria bacterium RIFCSPHIGHO2_02_FULL_47_12]|nr:MAG: hypothetical protein A3D14_02540 [Candidatus Saccharibacteria bacterium RIFCSPHIGHO2_02_FULL_47_12]